MSTERRRLRADRGPEVSGVRAAMAAKERGHVAHLRDRDGIVVRHFTENAERWQSSKPVEVSVWHLPAEYRPAGADLYDRVRVDAAGRITVVYRVADRRPR